ncbi:hypothetical protein [Hoylesella loescheii]|mgnify:CR=1|jgi:hypothetical protein|uniref:hypothetical protein n=1 Tax=Hoylesella loescheii TaxID=840 RepID=UPI0028E7AB31|nr:hypothetical protein [Hoylesella loescheii]
MALVVAKRLLATLFKALEIAISNFFTSTRRVDIALSALFTFSTTTRVWQLTSIGHQRFGFKKNEKRTGN